MWMGFFSNQGGDAYAPWNFDWGMAPLPRDAQPISQSWGWGYAITAQSQNPETSWQWISFLSQQMPNRLLPLRRSLAESAEFEGRVGASTAAVVRASLEEATLVSMQGFRGPEGSEFATQALLRALRRVAQGRATPYEALSLAQEQAE